MVIPRVDDEAEGEQCEQRATGRVVREAGEWADSPDHLAPAGSIVKS